MNRTEQIQIAIRTLAREKPVGEISMADVARVLGVHWTTVRRHIGGRAGLKALIEAEFPSKKQDQDHPDTRTRILAAAARLFAQQGYDGANLDEVATEAGLTKGAVYWHFTSKSDLFLHLLHQTVRQQMAGRPAEAEAILTAPNPSNALADWLQHQLPGAQTSPEPIRLFFEFVSSSRDPAVGEPLRGIMREISDSATGLIRGLQDARFVGSQVQPEVIALYLQALLNGLAMNWMLDPERVRPAEVAPALANLLLYGLIPREGD